MVCEICKDEAFLAQKAEPAAENDLGVAQDLLESAFEFPFQAFGATDAYPSLQQKAARLGYGLIKNHPFAAGNKRIGTHTMLVFLAPNGVELSYSQKSFLTSF